MFDEQTTEIIINAIVAVVSFVLGKVLRKKKK